MARTPDRSPGVADEEGIDLETTSLASVAGQIRYASGRFSLYDSTGEYDPRSGSGLSEAQHEDLDTLVHSLSENAYQELTRTNGQVTKIAWWTDSGKTTKIREVDITRAGGQVSQVVAKQYDGGGTLKQTLTGAITRTGGRVTSIDWTET